MCSAKVKMGSSVGPRIFRKGLVAWILLFMVRLDYFEYPAGSGAKRVVWVLLVLRMRLLLVAHFVMELRYG